MVKNIVCSLICLGLSGASNAFQSKNSGVFNTSQIRNFCESGKVVKQNIVMGYGFPTTNLSGNEQCKLYSTKSFSNYSCHFEKNTFGYQSDSYIIEKNKDIHVTYPNIKQCKTALEIMESNGP